MWVTQEDDDGESGVSTFSFVLDTHAGELIPRLKSVDSWDRENRPVTSEPVIVFDGYEEGAEASWSMYGGQPWDEIASGFGPTAEVSFVGDVPSGEVQLYKFSHWDIAGNSWSSERSFNFVVAPPDAGKPGLIVPPSDSIFP